MESTPASLRMGLRSALSGIPMSNDPRRAAVMEPVLSFDPRTGESRGQVAVEADAAAVDSAVRAAHATLDALADRPARAALLRAAADSVESRADELIGAADAETALGVARLTRELARVAYQVQVL